VWYAALVIFLAIVAGVFSFGFHATWVGAFLSRFLFGPELFNIDMWMPTVIEIAITSVMIFEQMAPAWPTWLIG
jgi:hypothetical protein